MRPKIRSQVFGWLRVHSSFLWFPTVSCFLFLSPAGNLEAPVRYNNTAIYYRGARVLKLVMAYLINTTGLRVAKKVILSGVSGKHIISNNIKKHLQSAKNLPKKMLKMLNTWLITIIIIIVPCNLYLSLIVFCCSLYALRGFLHN